MQGLSIKGDYVKKHCKRECSLFMEKTLSDKDKHGWGRHMDFPRLPGPFGRPKDHVWEGKESGLKQVKKPSPIRQESWYL